MPLHRTTDINGINSKHIKDLYYNSKMVNSKFKGFNAFFYAFIKESPYAR